MTLVRLLFFLHHDLDIDAIFHSSALKARLLGEHIVLMLMMII